MRFPEPYKPELLDQTGVHAVHVKGLLLAESSSGIPGQWDTYWCHTCQAHFDVYRIVG